MNHGGDRYRNEVDLDFSININPLGMPEGVRKSLFDAVKDVVYYPDSKSECLVKKIAEVYGTAPEEILVGNGASELIHALMHALPVTQVLLPMPSFAGYRYSAMAVGCPMKEIPLREANNFRMTEEMEKEILLNAANDRILFLTNPNNPTGACISGECLERILNGARERHMVVLLDECFMELSFGPDAVSMLQRRQEWPNLLILRAFTKSHAIPGVRLGVLVGDRKLLAVIRSHLPEWNVSAFAQAAGLACLQEEAYLVKTRAMAKEEQVWMKRELEEIGWKVYPSDTIFLLFQSPDTGLYQKLLRRRILIRDCSDYPGLDRGYYRIAVKQRKENEILLSELREIAGMNSDGMKADGIKSDGIKSDGMNKDKELV